MKSQNGEFKGSTKQHLADIDKRLDRIETKLDKVINRNVIVAAGTSLITSLVAAVSVVLVVR